MSGTKARVEADALAIFKHPFGARLKIAFVLGLSRDAGKPNVIAKFAHEARLVFFEVI